MLCRDVMVVLGREIAVSGITFGVDPGQRVAIIGPNVVAKRTLLRAIVRLIPLTGGLVEIDRRPVGERLHDVAFVSRYARIDWSLPESVANVVGMGRYPRVGWIRRLTTEDRRATDRAIERVGLTRVHDWSVGELSLGQQQRVLLARGLAQEPKLLLLDDPLTGIDLASRMALREVLSDEHRAGRTILLATEDLGYAQQSDLVILLDREIIRAGTPEEVFQSDILREAYDDRLVVLSGRG